MLLLSPRGQRRRAGGEEARAGLSTAGQQPGRGAERRPPRGPRRRRRCSCARKTGASARRCRPFPLRRLRRLRRPSRPLSTTPGARERPRSLPSRPPRARGRRLGGPGRRGGAARRQERKKKRSRSPRRTRRRRRTHPRLFQKKRRRSGCSELLLPSCSMPERDEIELLS